MGPDGSVACAQSTNPNIFDGVLEVQPNPRFISHADTYKMALYKKAGEILEKLEAQRGTVRSLCLADDVKDKKRTYALVCETLKCTF